MLWFRYKYLSYVLNQRGKSLQLTLYTIMYTFYLMRKIMEHIRTCPPSNLYRCNLQVNRQEYIKQKHVRLGRKPILRGRSAQDPTQCSRSNSGHNAHQHAIQESTSRFTVSVIVPSKCRWSEPLHYQKPGKLDRRPHIVSWRILCWSHHAPDCRIRNALLLTGNNASNDANG